MPGKLRQINVSVIFVPCSDNMALERQHRYIIRLWRFTDMAKKIRSNPLHQIKGGCCRLRH